jgi:hypothetical protein
MAELSSDDQLEDQIGLPGGWSLVRRWLHPVARLRHAATAVLEDAFVSK